MKILQKLFSYFLVLFLVLALSACHKKKTPNIHMIGTISSINQLAGSRGDGYMMLGDDGNDYVLLNAAQYPQLADMVGKPAEIYGFKKERKGELGIIIKELIQLQ